MGLVVMVVRLVVNEVVDESDELAGGPHEKAVCPRGGGVVVVGCHEKEVWPRGVVIVHLWPLPA